MKTNLKKKNQTDNFPNLVKELDIQVQKVERLPNKINPGLAGVVQWIEGRPVNQKAAFSIPSKGTCLGCVPDPQSGHMPGVCDKQTHIDISLPLFLPPFPSV